MFHYRHNPTPKETINTMKRCNIEREIIKSVMIAFHIEYPFPPVLKMLHKVGTVVRFAGIHPVPRIDCFSFLFS